MEEKVIDLYNLVEELKDSTGYLVTVTLLKDGILTHHFLTSNFPTGDIKTSMEEINKLSKSVQKPKMIGTQNEPKK